MSASSMSGPAAAPTHEPSGRGGRDWVWLAILWAVVTAYNLFKAYHIDDTVHLDIARWIIGHPLHPMSGPMNWDGVDEPIWHTNQPHLYFYLLAAWGRILGFSEPAMHALQALTALAGILLFHRLARALVGPLAIWATTILVLGPAFMVEQNLMVDVPLLALWLAFFNLVILGADDPNQTRRFALAGLACGAALLVKYSSLALLPVLGIALLAERRKAQAWTVLIPLAILAAWSLFNVMDYGHIHIATRQHDAPHSKIRPLLLAIGWVLGLGALTPLGVIAAVQSRPLLTRLGPLIYLATGLLVALLAVGVASGHLPDRLSGKLLWALFAVNGALIALALVPSAWRLGLGILQRRAVAPEALPAFYLFVWILGTTAFYVLFTPFLASRHVLLVMPPVILLFAMSWGSSLTQASKAFGLAFVVVLSAGLGLSDWRFADFYRTEAAGLGRSLPKTGAIWASGHWGWQWYAQEQGFTEVDIHASVLKPGDVLLVAKDEGPNALERPVNLQLMRTDTQTKPLLNLFCTGSPALFYLYNELQGPWSISRSCLNHVEIYRVEAGSPTAP